MMKFTDRSDPVRSSCIAAIDVGSNSTHMLVVEVGEHGVFQIIDNLKEQTRLAADINDRLLLDSNALSKMTAVLRRMKEIASKRNAVVRCIATHPLREARNGAEFATKLSTKVGIPVEIVSGQEEARLVSLGVRAGLAVNDRASLIVDVGGGSAEIVLCQWDEVRFATSLKLGAVRLTQKFLCSDPFSESELKSLEEYIVSRLEPVCFELKRFGFDLAVGSSGTIKALKALAIGIHGGNNPTSYHGTVLTREELFQVTSLLCRNRSAQERKMLPMMDAKRADIIVAGAMVFKVLAELVGISSFTLSTTALREGILVDTLAREHQWLRGDAKDVRWQSVREFGERLKVDEPHAFHISSLTIALFDSLAFKGEQATQWRELLRCAAYLHECGKFVNVSGFHKHAQYLIKNSSLLGFSQRELDIIGALVRFHRKRVPRFDEDCFETLDKNEHQWVYQLSSLLRLAVSLDRGRQGRVRRAHLSQQKAGKMTLSVSVGIGTTPSVELYDLNCEKLPFERAFGTSLEVRVEAVSA